MKREDRTAAARAALHALRDDPSSPRAQETLTRALDGADAAVVEVAARIVGEAELDKLARRLPAVFDRFLEKGETRDKGCRAKTAIAEALVRLRAPWADDVFSKGIKTIQMEPTWGGREDTASMLRGHCAMGLAVIEDPGAAVAAAELLADAQAPARIAAARALGFVPAPAALPVLRYKVLAGDPEPQVVGECFRTLLAVAPASSIEVVAAYLESDDEGLAEQAALALGESRVEGALACLKGVAESPLGPRRRVGLLAIAMLRSDEARAYLLERVAEAPVAAAAQAVEALAIYKHDPAMRARVMDAARGRGEPALLRKAEEELGGG